MQVGVQQDRAAVGVALGEAPVGLRDGIRDEPCGVGRQAGMGRDEVLVLDDLSTGRPETLPAGVSLIEGDVGDRDLLDLATVGCAELSRLQQEALAVPARERLA